MGLRFSKSFAPISLSGSKSEIAVKKPKHLQAQEQQQQQVVQTSEQQQRCIPTTSAAYLAQSNNSLSAASCSLSNNSSSCPTQIIIKIQLTKMENGNELAPSSTSSCAPSPLHRHSNQMMTVTSTAADVNSNSCPPTTAGSSEVAAHPTTTNRKTTQSSASTAASHGYKSIRDRFNELQIGESEIVEYSEIFERNESESNSSKQHGAAAASVTHSRDEELQHLNVEEEIDMSTSSSSSSNNNNSCCRRKSKSSSNAKRRCGKCTCRDVIRRFMEPSSSKQSKATKDRSKHSSQSISKNGQPPSGFCNNVPIASASAATTMASTSKINTQQLSIWTSPPSAMSVASTSAAAAPSVNANRSNNNNNSGNSSPLAAVINSPQIVVVQCPPSMGAIMDDALLRRLANEIVETTTANGANVTNSLVNSVSVATATAAAGAAAAAHNRNVGAANGMSPVVHSQVDYVHFLVPDLDKIFNSTYYWGKMDRYQAESLLDGKPEGTFLLRDSAQEEFLFSVTFRKYGRSLHARIEQSGHKFSFDCHDPCVFTASTVTGLLEHYKDACVMFFEPMLTIPLHRKTTFSLQELSRSVIASRTTYDGINHLELPSRLKSYLKEYHYKHKLRVKPLDEPFYSCT